MRPARRIFVVVNLLIFLISGLAWGISFRRPTSASRVPDSGDFLTNPRYHFTEFGIWRGRGYYFSFGPKEPWAGTRWHWQSGAPMGESVIDCQFGLEQSTDSASSSAVLIFPLCLPTSVSFIAVLCLWIVPILRQGRRSSSGLCEKCGYDLRATPDRCPECGFLPNPV